MQSIRSLIVSAALFAVASAAQAEPFDLVSIDASLRQTRFGRQQISEAVLDVTMTAHDPRLATALVQITVNGTLLEADSEIMPVALPEGQPVHLPLNLTRAGEGPFGIVRVAVRPRDATTDDPFGVAIFHFASRGASIRQVDAREYDGLVTKLATEEATARAQRDAERRAKELIAAGRNPVPFATPSASPEQAAWNRVAERYRSEGDVHAACGFFYVSSNNTSFRYVGNVRYFDDYYWYRPAIYLSQGYPIAVTTLVEYTDGCGNYQYRYDVVQSTTSYSGSFDLNLRTLHDPTTQNPIMRFAAWPRYTGLNVYGTTIVIPELAVGAGDMNYQWNGIYGFGAPTFNSLNTQAHFFRWDEQIKRLKDDWTSVGFGYSYSWFQAGFRWGTTYGTKFEQAAPGLVVYDESQSWTSKWIMAHELGHFFNYHLQGDNFLCCGGPHEICQLLDEPRTAMSEGFADWCASYWEPEGREVFYSCYGGECGVGCPNGWRRQGNVHAFFWDLFDYTNDSASDGGIDTVMFPLTILAQWTHAPNGYVDFQEFYNDFRDHGKFDPYVSVTDQLKPVDRVNTAQ